MDDLASASAPAPDLERHLEELRGRAARLHAGNRDLAARLHGVQARAALVRLTNARLRAEAEASALARRLAAASRALALRQMYAASVSASGDWSCGAGGFFELQALASLIA
ncbi:unnamed protein product [Miscanthus lutarioriparius]|uniref:Uncharacterized protein n=1 Tax=Miscanthus lutarioriparius TaxID=422564 RepID=A0A811RVJ4_9POAL|nr:unnamed protein product [Miscanthus lutarioriparius]